MADPLSIASGIAGLLTLVGETAVILNGIISDIRNAPSHAKMVSEDIRTIQNVLRGMQNFITNNGTGLDDERLSAIGQAGVRDALDGCTSALRALQEELGILSGDPVTNSANVQQKLLQYSRKAFWLNVRWVFKQPGIKEASQNLQNQKVSLILVLQTVSTTAGFHTAKAVELHAHRVESRERFVDSKFQEVLDKMSLLGVRRRGTSSGRSFFSVSPPSFESVLKKTRVYRFASRKKSAPTDGSESVSWNDAGQTLRDTALQVGIHSSLHEAIEAKDAGHLQQLLETLDTDINFAGASGLTPLHRAVCNNDVTIAEILVSEGADPQIPFPKGAAHDNTPAYLQDTPFVRALLEKDTAMVEVLLGSGFDTNVSLARGGEPCPITALQLAVCNRDAETVKALVQASADINTVLGSGITPLQAAIQCKDPATANILLRSGADINERYPHAYFKLGVFRNAGLSLLESNEATKVSESGSEPGLTPLQAALLEDFLDTAMTEVLITAGADINERYPSCSLIPGHEVFRGLTPLAAAVHRKHSVTAQALLTGGADPNTISCTGYSPLLIATKQNDIETLKVLIDAGADVNLQTSENHSGPNEFGISSALEVAVHNGYSAAVKLLLDAGAEANRRFGSKGLYGEYTPLQVAVIHGDVSTATHLVQAGADVYATCPNTPTFKNGKWAGYTPPQIAVVQRNVQMVKSLLEAGADINNPFPDNDRLFRGQTPLQLAVSRQMYVVAMVLIEAGADVETPFPVHHNLRGYTPLLATVQQNDVSMAEILLKSGANARLTFPVSSQFAGQTLVEVAELNRNNALIELLVKSGVVTSAAPSHGNPVTHPLLEGAATSESMVGDENPDEVSTSLDTLETAVYNGDTKAVRLHAEAGSDFSIRYSGADEDYHERTLLQISVCRGHGIEMAAILIAAGADVNATFPQNDSCDGVTLLHVALFGLKTPDFDLARALVDAGAHPDAYYPAAEPCNRFTVLLAAVLAFKSVEITSFILQLGADVNRPLPKDGVDERCTLLQSAVLRPDIEMAKVLLSAGADINAKFPHSDFWYRHTPIQKAVASRDLEMAKVLIDAGADLEAPLPGDRAWPGIAPLHAAITRQNNEMAALLLESGANPDTQFPKIPSYTGFTPLQFAVEEDDQELMELLLKAGADANIKHPITGMTALHYAYTRLGVPTKENKLIPLLLQHGADDTLCESNGETPLQLCERLLAAIADGTITETVLKGQRSWQSYEQVNGSWVMTDPRFQYPPPR